MDLFVIKKIIILTRKKMTKHTTITIHNSGGSSFQTGLILKQFSKIRRQTLQSYSLLRDLQVPSSSTQLPPATHPYSSHPRPPHTLISSSAPSLIDTESLGSLWMRKPCWRSTLLPPWLQRSLSKTIVAGCSGGYLGQRCAVTVLPEICWKGEEVATTYSPVSSR